LKTLIKDITHIQTGLFAKPSGVGELVYLQSKNFDEFGQLQTVLHPDLMANAIPEKHNEPSVASTSFFVIRILTEVILPHYLAWFLNAPASQTLLKGQAIGTSIPSISKQVLENMEIIIPSIETQNAILKIAKLRKEEKSLKQKIDHLREMHIQQIILNAINPS
jgi:restriction endonuclease S subunit